MNESESFYQINNQKLKYKDQSAMKNKYFYKY